MTLWAGDREYCHCMPAAGAHAEIQQQALCNSLEKPKWRARHLLLPVWKIWRNEEGAVLCVAPYLLRYTRSSEEEGSARIAHGQPLINMPESIHRSRTNADKFTLRGNTGI